VKKIKICGLSQPNNQKEILALQPDFAGVIFAKTSPRYFSGDALPKEAYVTWVAVFVNETTEEMIRICQKFEIQTIQLHGSESVAVCRELKANGYTIVKAFGIDATTNWEVISRYENHVDYFLFDTKGKFAGGNGLAFDWDILQNYHGKNPFWLSGGLGEENIQDALQWHHPKYIGLDLNSKLEDSPGIKNVNLTKRIIDKIRNI
jgi:phosphoribosylanthranilate isomerase